MTTPTDAASPAPVSAPGPRHRWHWRRYLILFLLAVLLLSAAYSWFVVNWDYSNGYRSGQLQKFSQKGWICKTHEGELWQSVFGNVVPNKDNIWLFTVRSDRVAHQLETLVGKNVRLHYTEHRGIPSSCFGDTRYFVDSVAAVGP
ncbi:MAG TPA: hypothetical protein VMG41_08440 [Gemmatimonadales bacterium]|nr:hypothetical protein [Gemmatimonadales bacterium]